MEVGETLVSLSAKHFLPLSRLPIWGDRSLLRCAFSAAAAVPSLARCSSGIPSPSHSASFRLNRVTVLEVW